AVEPPSSAAARERMLQETRLVESLMEAGDDESLGRAENLREFVGAAQEFDLQRAARPPPGPEALEAEAPPLQAFLEQISLVAEADAEAGEGRVSLMTREGAKGLEFDAVFLPGMEDGVFPHQRALDQFGDDEEMGEERRLCYVGFTRARKRLLLSLAQARSLFGELRFNPPSRFLREVPKELFDFQPELRAPPPEPSYGRPERRPRYDDTGPRIDRSYAQDADYMEDGSVVGMRVRHAQFGEGEVMACDGSGPNAKLTVRVRTGGVQRRSERLLQPASALRAMVRKYLRSFESMGCCRFAQRVCIYERSTFDARPVYPGRNRRPPDEVVSFRAGEESVMASKKPVIAVVGATGAQGGGLVRAILRDPQSRFTARAITRKPDSEKARALAAQGAEVVAGDADDAATLDRACAGAAGVSGITNFWEHSAAEREIARAGARAQAAARPDVKHVIWSTLEDTRLKIPLSDDRMPTLHGKYKVPHFD